MMVRTIFCDVKGCAARFTEGSPGGGFEGWGHVAGLMDEEGNTTAYVCPTHLDQIKRFLNEGDKHAMDRS